MDSDLVHAGRTVSGMNTRMESRWRLSSVGNRAMWAVLAAFLVWLATHAGIISIAVGVVAFLVLTAVAATRRG